MPSPDPTANRIAGKTVLAFVMAGGEGSRLHPLTQHRSKPSVPFNGRHRIVDFVLSNLVNSGVYSIYLLVQYKSQSLIEHVRKSWTMATFLPQHFITVVPPQMHRGPDWFQGTADAVGQNLHLIERLRPDLVAVFGADHVYRMDVRQMVDHHLATGADASIAALPVPLEQAHHFGILETDDSSRITRFDEKPKTLPPSMPGRKGYALASMGNYLFDTELLLDALTTAHENDEQDFGKHVLPRLSASHRVVAYDFATNGVPGVRDCEEPAYWRDVGTIDAYFEANFDTLGQAPRFCMNNHHWPIYAASEQVESTLVLGASMDHVTLSAGGRLEAARLQRCLLRREVVVEQGADLQDCIVMDRSRIGAGARIRRAIIDQDNIIRPGERIGFDLERDRERFHVSESGIVVVGRGELR